MLEKQYVTINKRNNKNLDGFSDIKIVYFA